MANWVSRVVGFLRAGYPAGAPAVGYVPLLALMPRRASDDEITAVTELFVRKGRPIDSADMGVEISRITNDMPSQDDIDRVHDRLGEIGRSGGHAAPGTPSRTATDRPPSVSNTSMTTSRSR